MTEPSEMTLAELEAYLARLRDDLDDIEDERKFVLSQTGLHVSAREVKKFETRVGDLQDTIATTETLIASKKTQG